MSVVVTGGAGFVGSHIAARLAERGFKVVAVDSLERASAVRRLEEAEVPLVVGDVRFVDLPPADAVVHAAAYISVEESWERPYEYMWNKPGNDVLLEAKRPKITVVIPTLNEEATIGRVIQKAKETLEAMGLVYEIIVADNSTDKTPEIARSLGATVVTPDRRGYGYAYLYAFRHVTGDIIVIADGDDTYDMRELPKLLQPIPEGKADMTICTRLKGKILKGAMPWHHRYIGNPLITWLLNTFYKVGVSDSQCGFRAITKQALEKLQLESTGMEFATDVLIKAKQAGLRIVEIPITYYPRTEGSTSKLKKL